MVIVTKADGSDETILMDHAQVFQRFELRASEGPEIQSGQLVADLVPPVANRVPIELPDLPLNGDDILYYVVSDVLGTQNIEYGFASSDERRLFSLIGDVCDEASADDWDDEGGKAVDEATRTMALQVAQAVPWWAEDPMSSVTPTGEFLFEWRSGNDSIVTLSVRGDGRIMYVAITPSGRVRGTERFSGRLPGQIANLLRNF